MAVPTSLDHCVIHITDWERSNTFYVDVMGAELISRPVGFAYRFGDRQLNKALHVIVRWRMLHDQRTRAYLTRRAPHKTDPEIRRCLKRYAARQLYRLMEATATT